MTEKTGKKTKIYKLATELNLSSETMIEFLAKKGYEVKSHMSSVDEEMYREVLTHFKKDKDLAERHQRKIHELKEKRKERKLEEKEVLVAQERPKEEAVEEKGPAVSEPAPVAEPTQVEGLPPTVIETAAEEETAEAEEVSRADPVTEEVVETRKPGRAKKPGKEKEVQPARVEPQARGLRIKGRIDLDKMHRVASSEAAERAAAVRVAPGPAEEPKKKKKKKKIREETRATKEGEVEGAVPKKKKKKIRYLDFDQEEVDEAIRRTFQMMVDAGPSSRAIFRRKKRKERQEEEQRMLEALDKEKTRLRVTEFVTVSDLANLMGADVSEVIKKCIDLGLMVSINQRLDKDTITLVADEFGFDLEFYDETTIDLVQDIPDREEDLKARPPVVTVMGHVDHGKTSLLDYVRKTKIVSGEVGGITQHIGAYQVVHESGKEITFLDTPGHEAFTAMRARGAQITDIVVLVVAAEDSVMPQTVEAINHSQAAGVHIIIAINKVDKPDANPDRIRQQLAEKGVLVEEWGGKHQCVEISAKTGKNVSVLLEKILLEAEILDLRANPHRPARGTIIEAQLDKGKGILATVLVLNGSLKVGDPFIAGVWSGRVRAMFDERGTRLEVAKPGTPAQVIGFDGIPQAGDHLIVVDSDRQARDLSFRRLQLKREQDFRQVKRVTLDDISLKIQEGQVKELNVIVKGDVDGSVEALSDALMRLSNAEVKINVIHRGVGGISESDVLLAAASGAVIVGFHVRPNIKARRLAEQEVVDIRLYSIIYEAINDFQKALEGLLEPEIKEEVVATVEVREIFKVPKVGTVAGCYVQEGKVTRNNKVRLVRDAIQIYEGTIASLKRFKDDVREVESGFECGMSLENFSDIKVGDVIEAFKVVEVKRKL
ncbi:MAG: translation initiation factor IF-2 [Bacteroidota bacterium]